MAERVTEAYTLELAEEHVGNLNGNVDRLTEAHQQDDTDLIPNTPTTGHIMFASTGHMKYVSGVTGDSVTYNTGRNTNGATSPLTFTTSLQTVPGLTISLGVGTYRIHAQILINNPGTAGQGTITIQTTLQGGLTVSNGRWSVTEIVAGTGNVVWANYDAFGNSMSSGNAPGANTNNRTWTVDGYAIVSVAGTLAIQMKQAATAACNTVQYGTYLETMPVT